MGRSDSIEDRRILVEEVWLVSIVAGLMILAAAALAWLSIHVQQVCRRLPRLVPGVEQMLAPHWRVLDAAVTPPKCLAEGKGH